MIDIHTHILPGVDDGSSSIEESEKMLGMLSEQGVDTVVATPHFYIDDTKVEEFLELRWSCAEKLIKAVDQDVRPQIVLGAEVQFFPELYTMDNVEKLCISGTKYMLVEMPFEQWSGYTYKTLSKLYTARGIVPIIAHVERYLEFQEQSDTDVLRKLKEANALIQTNCSFLTDRTTKRRALKLVKKDLINFMGSDCHNMTTRMPIIEQGYRTIFKKLGEDGLAAFEYWEYKLKEKMEAF